MFWYCNSRKKLLVLLFLFSFFYKTDAQEASKEFWPELDIWWRVSPSWRFSSFIPLSKNLETNYREGSFSVQADYSWGKKGKFLYMRLFDSERAQSINSYMLRSGYIVGKSLGDKGETYSENLVFTELHVRIPLNGGFLLTSRFRSDFRWLGEDNEFSNRLRFRLMMEKDFNTKNVSFVPFCNVEANYDSRYSTINRFRMIGGSSVSWSSRYALEGNLTYQHDTRSSVTNLYALNIILHLYFATDKANKN